MNKANVDTPMRHDFVFAENFYDARNCYYYKTENNQVVVRIGIALETYRAIRQGEILAYLPVGFRPLQRIEQPTTMDEIENGYSESTISISSDGSVVLHHNMPNKIIRAIYSSTFIYIAEK